MRAWACPACAADCPPGAVMCAGCWAKVPEPHKRAVTAAWRHSVKKGFGEQEAADALDEVLAAAAKAIVTRNRTPPRASVPLPDDPEQLMVPLD